MNATRLIVNADDLGMSRGITDGILVAHKHGFLTSASLMANMPAAEYAVARLATAPHLGVGVHLNICQGRPLLRPVEVRSMVDSSGQFHPPSVMARKLWRWQIDRQELEAEFREQIRWLKHRGITPTHADSHHQLHVYPAAVRPFAKVLSAEGIHRARAPRCGQWPASKRFGGPHAGGLLRRLLVQIYRATLQRIVLRSIDSPERRIAFDARHQKQPIAVQWRAVFENLPGGIFELACHPGFPESGFSETDALSDRRERELRCLIDPELRNVIHRRGIELISYDEISPHGPLFGCRIRTGERLAVRNN